MTKEWLKESQENSNYQSYDEGGPVSGRPSELELSKAFEKERILEDYRRDAEFIKMSLQQALKEKRYKEAQELVFQYRFAVDIDPDFQYLSKLSKENYQKNRKLYELQLELDATPEDAHQKRLQLYAQLLQFEPQNESYQRGLKVCQKSLGLQTQEALQRPSRAPSFGHWFIFVFLSLLYIGSASDLVAAASDNILWALYGMLSIAWLALFFPPVWRQFSPKHTKWMNYGVFALIQFVLIFILLASD